MSVGIDRSSTGTLNQGTFNKRRASDDENKLQDDNKRPKFSCYYILEQESSEQTDDDTESIYTAQEYETELARDTSDTSTHTWVSESEIEDHDMNLLEYDIDSASDTQQLFNSLSSASEPEEKIFEIEFFSYSESENLADMADDSDVSRSSIDSEIPVSFFKTCVQCKKPNNTSMYQYCSKCFQNKRETYFPRRKRKSRSTCHSSKISDRKTTTSSKSKSTNSQELVQMDSGVDQCDLGTMMESGKELSFGKRGDASLAYNSQTSETSNTLESSQASEILGSQMSEFILSSQDSGIPMFSSQDSEVMPSASQDSKLTLPASQGNESTLSTSHASEGLMSTSQSNEMSRSTSQSSEELLYHSRSSNLSSSQTSTITMTSIATSLAASQETTDEVDSDVMSKDEQFFSQDSFNDEKRTDEEDAELTKQTLLKKLQNLEKENNESSMLCITCFESKRDSVFTHGKTGHQCCCYKCAKKVCMSNNNRCPMCNRRVNSITKIFLD